MRPLKDWGNALELIARKASSMWVKGHDYSDVLQTARLGIVEAWPQFNPEKGKLRPFLSKAARVKVYNLWQAYGQTGTAKSALDPMSEEKDSEGQVFSPLEVFPDRRPNGYFFGWVSEFSDRLKKESDRKALILLVKDSELKATELGEILGLPYSEVRKSLDRVRSELYWYLKGN